MTLRQINGINGCEIANEIGQANSGMREFNSLRKSKKDDSKLECPIELQKDIPFKSKNV